MKRLHQHEGLAGRRAAEHPGAGDQHHVADRRTRGPRVRYGIAVVQQVVGRKILEQVAEGALDHQGEQHRARHVALGVLRFLAHRRDGLEADQDENGDAGLDEHVAEPVGRHHRPGARVEVERERVLRIALLPGQRILGLVADGKRIGDRVAVLVDLDLAGFVLLPDRVRVTLPQAHCRQRAQHRRIRVFVLSRSSLVTWRSCCL